MKHFKYFCLAPAASLALLSLAGCFSSSGGGSSQPTQHDVIVLPKGEKVVCSDGSDPPCPSE